MTTFPSRSVPSQAMMQAIRSLDFHHDKIPPRMAASEWQKTPLAPIIHDYIPLPPVPSQAMMQAIRSLDFHHDKIPTRMAVSDHIPLSTPLPFPSMLSLDFHHKILIRVAVAEWPNFSSRNPPPPPPPPTSLKSLHEAQHVEPFHNTRLCIHYVTYMYMHVQVTCGYKIVIVRNVKKKLKMSNFAFYSKSTITFISGRWGGGGEGQREKFPE